MMAVRSCARLWRSAISASSSESSPTACNFVFFSSRVTLSLPPLDSSDDDDAEPEMEETPNRVSLVMPLPHVDEEIWIHLPPYRPISPP